MIRSIVQTRWIFFANLIILFFFATSVSAEGLTFSCSNNTVSSITINPQKVTANQSFTMNVATSVSVNRMSVRFTRNSTSNLMQGSGRSFTYVRDSGLTQDSDFEIYLNSSATAICTGSIKLSVITPPKVSSFTTNPA
ncbi:hypothetical protein, partial [Rheinheimera sediminis]|uniref:hypothetical protein n=1 Tax=Rheinheimera sp. YQF-1 TaxID=2499626 RepID=UPI001C97061D